ncbi:Dihydroxyacetone kinase family protein OS=Streptomyces tendae OX=1932 GN=GUR47_05555 PE=4 SV=1 [Streptomyces tendae]
MTSCTSDRPPNDWPPTASRPWTFAVADDISSAGPDESAKRRGIAGDLPVFKAAAAAAEQGLPLREVLRVAERAGARTRSFGIAFSGCTLPGADHPLFTVPEARMAVGLGIHGEPGIGEEALPTADEAALELLVDTLLKELPEDVAGPAGQRAAVILNGLGSVKYEELFVVYRKVAALLGDAGVEIVDPEVGELVTSFDMAGISLTLTWLDDRLEELWRAPADTPAYRKGALDAPEPDQDRTPVTAAAQDAAASAATAVPAASDASRRTAATVLAALDAAARVVDAHADELGRIDAVAGDGDHGIGMRRGSTAALRAATDAHGLGAGAGTVLTRAADAWADKAGGTSGALWGTILRSLGTALGDLDAPDAARVAEGVTAGPAPAALRRLGGAETGDKTMVDVLVPFAGALAAATADGLNSTDAWDLAATTATAAAAGTADLLPRRGRARPHAEKSHSTRAPTRSP